MKNNVAKGILAVLFLAVCFMTAQPQKVQAAQAVAISSAQDLLKMENDPSGSYYLTKDITVPAGMELFKSQEKQFKGTLDGKGHAIKGYTYSADAWVEYAGLISYAENATFKNLTMSNVNISIKKSGNVGVVVGYATKCTFENITVSGKITASGSVCKAAGVCADASGCTFTKCVNKADITINAYDVTNSEEADMVEGQGGVACGIACMAIDSTAKKCSNSGRITINGDLRWASDGIYAMGLFQIIKGVSGSKNTGAVTAKNVSKTGTAAGETIACGIVAEVHGFGKRVLSCYNTGTITASNNNKRVATVAAGIVNKATSLNTKILRCYNKGAVRISGVAGSRTSKIGSGAGGIGGMDVASITECYNKGKVAAGIVNKATSLNTKILRCYNKGAVRISGVAGSRTSKIGSGAGGIGGMDVASITECYNKGKVAANVKSGFVEVGGIAGDIYNIRNCYNTGKVSTTAKTRSYIGGVAGRQEAFSKGKGKVLEAAICNYNTGKVTAGKKVVKGSIFGHYEVAGITAQAMVYNNYYKSGKAYGSTNLSWKPFLAKATKVSSMKAKKCRKLSSKYWVYSSKYKRMVLKNNKEK